MCIQAVGGWLQYHTRRQDNMDSCRHYNTSGRGLTADRDCQHSHNKPKMQIIKQPVPAGCYDKSTSLMWSYIRTLKNQHGLNIQGFVFIHHAILACMRYAGWRFRPTHRNCCQFASSHISTDAFCYRTYNPIWLAKPNKTQEKCEVNIFVSNCVLQSVGKSIW